MSTSSSDNEPRSLLRLDEQTIESVLDKLDAEDMNGESADRRREKRYAHRVGHCVVKVIQPGTVNPSSFAVYLRNLSASGLSFLHGGFLHKGTRCVVQLASGAGKWTEISGQVVNCKYVEQGIHEVGVSLSTTIIPSDYCSAANCLTVLLVDDDVVSSRLVMHLLKGMNADVDHVPSGAEALTAVKRTDYGIVMCDLDMPEMDGCATVQQLRNEGFKGTILGISASEADEDRARMCDAGCNE
ncbi:MAG: response regulator, partial [Phycisphaerales bacterium]|nr:response regulator [Phycisphaerales bacterium]